MPFTGVGPAEPVLVGVVPVGPGTVAVPPIVGGVHGPGGVAEDRLVVGSSVGSGAGSGFPGLQAAASMTPTTTKHGRIICPRKQTGGSAVAGPGLQVVGGTAGERALKPYLGWSSYSMQVYSSNGRAAGDCAGSTVR